ncbi:BTAD domain-containing putative transcriptional regulator [Streptomyces sp. NPDC101733]|uniref:BTAD domain-containing putative transcriptional regulator n=1 Tax=unclassified Streptomyces TaxID=2593676 RepID=UPI0037F11A98
MVYIRVLGSFEAERDGEPLPLGGHRQRSVLALLVSARGRVVSVDRMIEELWQGAAPARAVASLQAYVSNLRRLLEPGRAPRAAARLLVSSPPGYALRLPDDGVDAWRFERLLGVSRARLDEAPHEARALVEQALALWRGSAYADAADERWSHAEILRLDELRSAARELQIRAGLRGPDPSGKVAEAALLTREEPLREEGWRLHALALLAAGRQADALATLRRAREVLAEEAGLDPGAALVALERAILAQEDGPLREARGAEPRGAAPEPRGAAPDPRGAAPERRGAAPERRGAAPEPRGAAPEPRRGSRGPVLEGLGRGAGVRPSTRPPTEPGPAPGPPPAALPRGGVGAGVGAPARHVARGGAEPGGGPAAAYGVRGGAEWGAMAGPEYGSEPVPESAPGAWAFGDPEALFVGRESELAALGRASERALAGGPVVALVAGEAGLGKSALLSRLRARLRGEGWLVAHGRATDAEGAPPAWPWVEALRAVAAEAPPPPGVAPVVEPLLADAPAAPRIGGEDAAAGRFRLHRAVGAWLCEAARERPVCLVLDDLHWAEPETLALLAATAELPLPARLLLVGAYRPDEVEGRLADTLAAVARRSPVRVALPGLAAGAVAEVVRAVSGATVDPETLTSLFERTGGNPFHVRESARLLGSEGALVALSEVPEGVRDVLRRRLARLPEPVVGVLRLAAVAGRETSLDLLVATADTDEDGVLGALEAAVLAGLLGEPAPGRVRFAHALVRDTLLADLSRVRATRMHARIGEALEAAGSADVSSLDHHFVRAGSAATAARAVAHCVRAAGLAEGRHAYESAAALLVDAVASFERVPMTPGADRDAERAELLGRLLRAQVRAGAVTAARTTRGVAVGHAVAAGREDLLVRAFTDWRDPTPWQTRPYGVVDRPVVTLLEGLLARPGLAPADRGRLLGAYAAERSDTRDPKVRAAAREALALADELGDPALRAASLAALIKELDADLEWPERAELGARLEQLATERDLPDHRWYGLFARSTAAAARGDVAAVRTLVEEFVAYARTYGLAQPQTVGDSVLATLAHIAGRTEEAERMYGRAAARMARQGSPHAGGYLAIATTTLRASEGRLGEAVPWARRLFAEFGPLAGDILAVALAHGGEPDEARAVLARSGPLPANYFFKVFGTFRAMTLVALGESRGAKELYAELLPYRDAPPPSSGFTVAVRPVAYTLGELAALLGRDADAAGHFARSAEIAEAWDSPWGRSGT